MPVLNDRFRVNSSLEAVASFHSDTRALRRLSPPPIIVQFHNIETNGGRLFVRLYLVVRPNAAALAGDLFAGRSYQKVLRQPGARADGDLDPPTHLDCPARQLSCSTSASASQHRVKNAEIRRGIRAHPGRPLPAAVIGRQVIGRLAPMDAAHRAAPD